jgi:hypothetical protein
MFSEVLAISTKRLLEVREQAMKLSKDTSMDGESRVDSLHLAAELDRVIITIHVDALNIPRLIASKSYPKETTSPEQAVKNHLTLAQR